VAECGWSCQLPQSTSTARSQQPSSMIRLGPSSHSPHVVDITYVRLLSAERKRVDGTIYYQHNVSIRPGLRVDTVGTSCAFTAETADIWQYIVVYVGTFEKTFWNRETRCMNLIL